ncbi:claudin-1-like [Scomber scombrus]|uniref:Claudin-1-like n=1 Tax=Scomber scombrus TaxID=13677 RepID=A0AAV1QIH6_SCOSC
MAVGLQVLGLVLGVVSWCLTSSCTSSQVWKVRSQAESVATSQWQMEAHLQVCRALMILSLLVGLASIIVSVLGLKCTKIGRTSEHVKDQIALSGGVLFILSGLFTLIAVSWYAARVIHDFNNPYGAVRFELGTGLYLGWGASCLALLGGSMLCCSCRKKYPTPPARQFSYNYSNSSRGPSIYRAAPASDNVSTKAYV